MIEPLRHPDHSHLNAIAGLTHLAVARQGRPTCASAPSTECLRSHHQQYRPPPTKTKPFGRPRSTGLANTPRALVPLADLLPSRALLAARPVPNKAFIVSSRLREKRFCGSSSMGKTLKKGPAQTRVVRHLSTLACPSLLENPLSSPSPPLCRSVSYRV